MTLLDNHLEQISACANGISELQFPPPKIFTNAMLHPHDITALIRDTDIHEQALFSVRGDDKPASRRRTTIAPSYDTSNDDASRERRITMAGAALPRRNAAVTAVLGGDVATQIRKGAARAGGEVDVELLLRGAEKLCGVYPIPDAIEKVVSLRTRYEELHGTLEHYEAKVAHQTALLEKMSRGYGDTDDEEEEIVLPDPEDVDKAEQVKITDEDLENEEKAIKELEQTKKTLEERVKGMERDLGGLMR